MSKYWKYFWLGYLWALPMTVVGFVISILFYKATRWEWRDGVLTCVAGADSNGTTLIWGKPNAQTLGWLQIYDSVDCRELPDLRVHENVHICQAFAVGTLGSIIGLLVCLILGRSTLAGFVIGGLAGGIGFAVIYAILFVYLLMKYRGSDWYWAYRNNPFEVQAYDLQDKYLESPTDRIWGAK